MCVGVNHSTFRRTRLGFAAHFLVASMWTPNQYASNHLILYYVGAQRKVPLRCSSTVAVFFFSQDSECLLFFLCVCCLIRECLS